MIADLVEEWDNNIEIKIPSQSLRDFEGVIPLKLIKRTGAISMNYSIADNAVLAEGAL